MRLFITLGIVFSSFILSSQQLYYPLNHENEFEIESVLSHSDRIVHTSFKPFLSSDINRIANFDSVLYGYNRDSLFLSKRKYKWFWNKLRVEDFILVDTTDFFLALNPLLNINTGKNTIDDSSLFVNTRGIMVKGNIGKTLSFYSDFFENQAKYPEYIRDYIYNRRVAPGQGRVRGFKGSGYDFSRAGGYLSFTPKNWINFQLGHYKNFIGEGYRSLLLSDVSLNYPFIKTTLMFKRFHYTYMLTSHQEISVADGRLLAYQRKNGSFNFLNLAINKNIQIGLLEAVIWKTTTTNSNNVFSVNYFNPVIYTRSLQYGLNDDNNILLGFTSKIIIVPQIQFYGQYVLDNYSELYTGQKFGYQAGMKLLEPAKIKNLYMQFEYNDVNNYTYAHTNTLQNYSNANEALAHPLGAGFKEYFGRLRYSYKDFYIDFQFVKAKTQKDTLGSHYGTDIYISDSLAMLVDVDDVELDVDIQNFSVQFGYIINPRTNLQLFVAYHKRDFINNSSTKKTNHIFFGIRTSLYNYYYDF